MKKLPILIQAIFIFSFAVKAQNPDPSFMPLLKGPINSLVKLAVQPDDKIIVGGSISTVGTRSVFGITRLNPDGTIDDTFNPNLKIPGRINDIMVQDDGKILISGQNLHERGDIIRLDENGEFDPTFVLDPELIDVGAVRARRLSDGSYIIGGFKTGNLFKMSADGSKDFTFDVGTGINGIGIQNFDMEIQSDGKILVGGSFTKFNGQDVKNIVRLNADGSIDESFNVGTGPTHLNGFRIISFIEIQSNGKILVTGEFDSFDGTDADGIIRLNADGSVDDTFKSIATFNNIFSSSIRALALLPDDKIVVSGRDFLFSGDLYPYWVVLLDPDGSINTSLTPPEYTMSRNGTQVELPSIVLNSQQNIIFGGRLVSLNDNYRLGVASTDIEGNVLDFDPQIGGRPTVNIIKIQSDNKVIVGGSFVGVGDYPAKNLVRLLDDGTIDPTFTKNIGIGTDHEVLSIEIQNNGKILIGGIFNSFNGENKRSLVRIESNGLIDDTFNSNFSSPFSTSRINYIHEQNDGKIVIAGAFNGLDEGFDHNFTRLNNDGSTDDTFNTLNQFTDYHINTADVLSNGKLIVGGKKSDNSGGFLFRTTVDGDIDSGFENEFDLTNRQITKIKVLNDERILLGLHFSSSFPSNYQLPVYQIDKNGTLLDDYSITTTNGVIEDILSMGDDEVILVGRTKKINDLDRNGIGKTNLAGVTSKLNPKIGDTFIDDGDIRVNSVIKLDEETLIIGGRFDQIRNVHGFRGMAKISLINEIPVITGVKREYSTFEKTPFEISIDDIKVIDTDNIFPDDFNLIIEEGEAYSVHNLTVTPNNGVTGTMTVSLAVSDGIDTSEFYDLKVEIIKILGIEKISHSDITIFPNPANDAINIKLTEAVESSYMLVNIYSLDGKVIFSKQFDAANTSNIDVKNFRPGLYILEASDHHNTWHKKLIIH